MWLKGRGGGVVGEAVYAGMWRPVRQSMEPGLENNSIQRAGDETVGVAEDGSNAL